MRDRKYCIGCGLVRAGSAQQRCARCGNVEFLSLDSMIAYLYGCVTLETENQQLRIELAWSKGHQDVEKLVEAARAALANKVVGRALAEALKPFEKEKQR